MSLPVFLRPQADIDVRRIFEDLELVREGLGSKFMARLSEMLERIESLPELYGVVWKDVRAARLKKFRYVVYYIVLSERVEVLAVLHGARDESAWKSRA